MTDSSLSPDSLSPQQRQWLQDKLDDMGVLPATVQSASRLQACVVGEDKDGTLVASLKQACSANLPAHMVPATIHLVEALPTMPNGKLDRRALSEFEWQTKAQKRVEPFESGAPDEAVDGGVDEAIKSNELVAPRNENERLLAEIWADVLGFDEISVHDDFFEVGGDSLLSIRILSRAHKAGLTLSASAFFEQPTIAQQAALAEGTSQSLVRNTDTDDSSFALLPIQHWFFERVTSEPQYWHQSQLLVVPDELKVEDLPAAIMSLLQRHDALRCRFVEQANQWHQKIAAMPAQAPLVHLSGQQLNADTITTFANQLAASISLENGELLRFGLINTPDGERNQLLIVIHHLIIDAESWRHLVAELEQYWANPESAKGSVGQSGMLHAWAQRLTDFAGSIQASQQLGYWLDVTRIPPAPLPQDITGSEHKNTNFYAQSVQRTLDKVSTDLLLKHLPQNQDADIGDALLTSLVSVIADWSESDQVWLEMEGHGREALFDDIDVSSTLGWFTSVFPVRLTRNSQASLAENLQSVRRERKRLPQKGLGYGILRYLQPDSPLAGRPGAQICFNYLGQLDRLAQPLQHLQITQNNLGSMRSPKGNRAYVLEINAFVEDGQLTLNWQFSKAMHQAETIENLIAKQLTLLTDIGQLDTTVCEPNTSDKASFDGIDAPELDKIAGLLNALDEN